MSTADLEQGAADLDALAAAARGSLGGVRPPVGLPNVAMLTKLANEFFAALPGQSLPVSAGPSLAGFGASPVEVAGTSAPHAAAVATSSAPTSGVPPALGTPASVSPFDTSAIDQRVFDSLIGAAGPSLPGIGASPTEAAGQPAVLPSPPPTFASVPGLSAARHSGARSGA